MDWSAFDTPFGRRTGDAVPPLLAKLDVDDARVRAAAVRDLHRRVVAVDGGYGTPYLDVALAVVRILGDRVGEPGTLEPQLPGVLAILGDCAAGNHRVHLGRGLPFDALDRSDIGPARAVNDAVAALVPAIVARLGHGAPKVRAAAAFALAWVRGPEVVPALSAALEAERNAVARGSMALALGYHGVADRADATLYGALGRALADPTDLDIGALFAPSKPVIDGLPFADGAVLTLRTAIVREATIRRGDLDLHLALVDQLPAALAPEARGWTVLVAAGGRRRAPPLDPADRSDRERAVLRDLAAALPTNPHLYSAFWEAGLFGYGHANERALGLSEPGPLDRRVAGHPLWWWLHEVRAERISEDRWVDLVRDDPLPVLEDAATAPYELYRDRFRAGEYDVEPLIGVVERTARALGVDSPTLRERLDGLRAYARDPSVRSGKGRIPWP